MPNPLGRSDIPAASLEFSRLKSLYIVRKLVFNEMMSRWAAYRFLVIVQENPIGGRVVQHSIEERNLAKIKYVSCG